MSLLCSPLMSNYFAEKKGNARGGWIGKERTGTLYNPSIHSEVPVLLQLQSRRKSTSVALDCYGVSAITTGSSAQLMLPDDSIDWSIVRFRNISLSFEVMLSPMLFDLKEAQSHQTWILEQCTKLIDEEKIKIHVSDVLPLKDATKAHELIESGHTTGKIVLEI